MSPTDLENVFYNDTTVRTGLGCTIEYNMNSLIDKITITSSTEDTAYVNGIPGWSQTGKGNPFKKLFPVDSIIKPFRPLYPGIKYYVMSTVDTPNGSYLPYRTVNYTGQGKDGYASNAKPRIYYPGLTTEYKYWLSAKDTNAVITLNYKTSGTGNKHALANKIIVRFEKSHALPTNYKVTITKHDDSTVVIGPANTPSSGNIAITYSGGSWSAVDAYLNDVSFTDYSAPIKIKSIKLEATNPGGGKYIGIIELSARWVKDLSSDIVDMVVSKELSSSSSESILPVGMLSANSLRLQLNNYNTSQVKIVDYVRDETEFDSGLTYIVKNAELKPYFKVFHSAGSVGESPNNYDRVKQGVYFVDTYSISQYGEASINALDGAKYLMDTFCPDLLCNNFPVTAILRNLLDSVGFTSYNFNLADTETSNPQIQYWWTEDSSTVWETIQELCRDIQMNGVMDENNILQFYSRDYMYSASRATDWEFTNTKIGSKLPNIIDFSKEEVAAGNYVKILWKVPVMSNINGSSKFLWDSQSTYLSAGGLKNPKSRPNGPAINTTDMEFTIDISTIDPLGTQQSFYNFNGYVLIDAEIIEFEAIGYDFEPASGGAVESVWIYSQSDINKYRTLAKIGFSDANDVMNTAYFKPNGRYKIKAGGRGALGTIAAEHLSSDNKLSGWTGQLVSW
jgi:hypothetical protein